MKKASILALVLMAAMATATPVLAAEAAPPFDAANTGAGQIQTSSVAAREQQQVASTPVITPTPAIPTSATPTSTIPVPTAVSQSQPLTQTNNLTVTAESLTGEVALTTTMAVTVTGVLDDPALDEAYAAVLEGTIIANRSDAPIRFFVEGRTYEVAPLRSIGLSLLRDTAILNLFNCEATKDDTDIGCFWDPYLLVRDGFYEVVIGQQLGQDILLSLRTAGAPPANQIWIQNRTGERETVIVNNELFEIAPAAVREFSIIQNAPVIVQLRTCINANGRSVCEWTPQGAEAGFYYGLVNSETPGPNNTLVTSLGLQGVIASSGEAVKAPPQAFCRLRVPTLNVRSGPGLEFPIIAKIRGTDTEPGSVVVVAFDATQTWMQVTERVARDGWVTANPEFILCEGALAELPVIGQPLVEATPEVAATPVTAAPPVIAAPGEATPAALVQPTQAPATAPAVAETAPQPAVSAPEDTGSAEEIPSEQVTPTPEVADVPEGLARIVVNNAFDQTIRFTLDQRYRPERENLSGEWDLEPGASVAILVYPGSIAFSASSAWRNISGNAEMLVDEKEDRALWITFVLDPVEPDRWNLVHY